MDIGDLRKQIQNSLYRPSLPRVLPYGFGFMVPVALVSIARLGFLPAPLARVWPSILFLSVIVSSWYGGLGPGVVSGLVVASGSKMPAGSAVGLGSVDELTVLLLLTMTAVVLSSVRRLRIDGKRIVAFPEKLDDRPSGLPLTESASARILESFRDTAIVALDALRHFTYVNQPASHLLQCAPNQLAGRPLLQVFSDGDAAKLSRHFGRVLESGEPVHFEEYLESRHSWFGFHCYPSGDGVVFNFSDITAYKKQEALRPLPVWQDDREFMRIFGKIDFTLVDHARCYILHQLAKQAVQLPGELAEVGVYKGGTAKLLALTIAPRAKKEMHLFDTFTGMPPADATADLHREGDLGDTSLEAVQRSLRECGNVRFYKGFFPDTAGPIENSRFCMVHVDADIYRSVKDCCTFFYPRMEPGGIMVFDDYGFPSCPGARKAVDEFFSDKPESPVYLSSGQCIVFRSGRSASST